tara:strand:+ start:354 stop:869 length:516 start_codon:yes stop_codon:yes gene_type:complete
MKKFLEELYLDLQSKGASYLFDFGKHNPEAMHISVSDLMDYKTGRSNLTFSIQQLYSQNEDGLYDWKDITCGRYCFKRIDGQHSTNGPYPWARVKYEISKIDTSERDMKQLTEFLSKTEKGEFSTCKKYLENNPHILLKWYQINTEQGGDNVGQWIAWTEMSLNEIDTYNY